MALIQLKRADWKACAACGDLAGFILKSPPLADVVMCSPCILAGRRPKPPAGDASPVLAQEAPRPAQGIEVLAVVDGDTLSTMCRMDDGTPHRIHIRILGIDAPERGLPEAAAATEYMSDMVGAAGGRVRLEADPGHAMTDRYGRLLRHVWAPPGPEGKLLSAGLVAAGLAVLDDRFPATKYDAALRAAWMSSRAAGGAPAAGSPTAPA